MEIESVDDTCILTVNEVEFRNDGIMLLRGCPPEDIPESMRGIFRFHSHRLTAILQEQEKIESINISTHLPDEELTHI